MSIQFADAVADAVSSLPEPYAITSSNNQFSVTIDGGSAQVITLTNGSARTATQIVADLSTLTSCTPSVCLIGGVNYVRIRGTSSNGMSSTILFNSPSNNSNTILGFVSGGAAYQTYTGGAVAPTTFLGDTKQDLASGIEDSLINGGWITVSGHHSSSIVVQSSCTPASQNLRMQVKITTANTNTVCVSLQNVTGSHVASNGSGSGVLLLPATGKGFKIYANKHQAFVTVPGSVQPRDFGAWGVPFIPTWLQGVIWECMWLQGNAASDTDTAFRASFRNLLFCGYWPNNQNESSIQALVNGNLWDTAGQGQQSPGYMSLLVIGNSLNFTNNGNLTSGFALWHDGSAVMGDPLIAWGLTSWADPAYFRGQLWNSFISNEPYPMETAISSLDSHNWVAITHNNVGSPGGNNGGRGTLFVTSS
jgi:hypothetical protein